MTPQPQAAGAAPGPSGSRLAQISEQAPRMADTLMIESLRARAEAAERRAQDAEGLLARHQSAVQETEQRLDEAQHTIAELQAQVTVQESAAETATDLDEVRRLRDEIYDLKMRISKFTTAQAAMVKGLKFPADMLKQTGAKKAKSARVKASGRARRSRQTASSTDPLRTERAAPGEARSLAQRRADRIALAQKTGKGMLYADLKDRVIAWSRSPANWTSILSGRIGVTQTTIKSWYKGGVVPPQFVDPINEMLAGEAPEVVRFSFTPDISKRLIEELSATPRASYEDIAARLSKEFNVPITKATVGTFVRPKYGRRELIEAEIARRASEGAAPAADAGEANASEAQQTKPDAPVLSKTDGALVADLLVQFPDLSAADIADRIWEETSRKVSEASIERFIDRLRQEEQADDAA